MFHSFASSTNEDESKTQCLFLFEGGSIILTKYFEVPYAGNPIVDTTLSWSSFSLVYVPLKFRTI